VTNIGGLNWKYDLMAKKGRGVYSGTRRKMNGLYFLITICE
jgi:hypothetical protein